MSAKTTSNRRATHRAAQKRYKARVLASERAAAFIAKQLTYKKRERAKRSGRPIPALPPPLPPLEVREDEGLSELKASGLNSGDFL
jgi:hypothetical protein